jgi:hypothetical protein
MRIIMIGEAEDLLYRYNMKQYKNFDRNEKYLTGVYRG